MWEQQDIHLLSKIKEGDTNTFNIIYKSYYPRLYAFANSYLKDAYSAGNIVQDAFMALWENRENLKSNTYLPAYLLTIVKNKALNQLSHIQTKIKVEENIQSHHLREVEFRYSTLAACDPKQMFHRDVETIIERTLSALPEKTRSAIMLSRFEGLSNKEIALKLEITIKGVEFHITKALKMLRENLKDYLITLFITFLYHFL